MFTDQLFDVVPVVVGAALGEPPNFPPIRLDFALEGRCQQFLSTIPGRRIVLWITRNKNPLDEEFFDGRDADVLKRTVQNAAGITR